LAGGGDAGAIAWRAGQGAAGWLLVLTAAAVVLRASPSGGVRSESRAEGRWDEWGREGVLPVYVVHQTVAVVLAAWIVSWPVAAGIQWLVLAVLTVACSLALYAVIRRFRVGRVLTGMRPARRGNVATR